MALNLDFLAAKKSFVLIASHSDDDMIPAIHFEADVHGISANTPEQQIACRTISFTEDGTIYTSLPVIFDLTCRIVQDDCHLVMGDDDERCSAISCWLEPCPDDISAVEWGRMLKRVGSIVSGIGETIDLSEMFRHVPRTNQIELQVCRNILVSHSSTMNILAVINLRNIRMHLSLRCLI